MLIWAFSLNAQNREIRYLNENFEEVKEKQAKYYQEIEWDDISKTSCIVKTYRIDDLLLKKQHYEHYGNKTFRDTSTYFRTDGNVEYQYVYGSANKKSAFIDYHFDGTIAQINKYDENGLSYQSLYFSQKTKKHPKREITSYGLSSLKNNKLTEKVFRTKDSSISSMSIFNVNQNNDLELITYNNYYENGNLFYTEYYHTDNGGHRVTDSLVSFYKTGELKRKQYFSRKISRNNECFAKDGKAITFTPLFEDASYPKGENRMMKWLSKNIEYPKEARENNITGTVYVNFVVCTDGELCEFEVVKGVHKSIDNSVLKALKKMPRWNPGKMDGEHARVHFTLPVEFTAPE